MRQLLAHPSQEAVIHLADASSHGVVDRRTRSLSSQLPNDSHGSSNKASHLRVDHSSISKTRTSGNSLDNAISADDQGIMLGYHITNGVLALCGLFNVPLCNVTVHY